MYKALIIDDEENICELISMSFLSINIDCVEAYSVSDAIVALQEESFDLCFTDLKLPDGSGFDILRYIQVNNPELPVAMMTAHGNVESAIEALKLGAFDFISKPFEVDELRKLALDAVETKKIPKTDDVNGLFGDTKNMVHLRHQIKKVARSQAPIYINGESGTGKEVVARAIHKESPRFDGPFIAINCGALPEHLVESELFGHKKGSFTGADKDKIGLFQSAEGGTLFLDEVADLPVMMQVKLLRAIQEKAIRPVGHSSEVSINVRVLSASHKNLAQLVEEQLFRQDLFYRLNVITLTIPALRERLDDIPMLAELFLSRLNTENNEDVSLSKKAIAKLKAYNFPGNVRELQNVIERAFALCDSGIIDEDGLLLTNNVTIFPSASVTHETVVDENINVPSDSQFNASQHNDNSSKSHNISMLDDPVVPDIVNDITQYLETVERKVLRRALEQYSSKTEAAKQLGISFRTFRYRLKKLKVEEDD